MLSVLSSSLCGSVLRPRADLGREGSPRFASFTGIGVCMVGISRRLILCWKAGLNIQTVWFLQSAASQILADCLTDS